MRLKWPKVTVVVTTYDRPEMLKECIEAIQAQTFQDFEMIVVDDASGTGKAVVEGFQPWFDDRAKRLTFLELDQRCGTPAASRNAGLAYARGSYVAYCDDDDKWLPHHLTTLVQLIEDTSADLVYSCWEFDTAPDHELYEAVWEYIPLNILTQEMIKVSPTLNFISSHVLFSRAAVLGFLGTEAYSTKMQKAEDWDFMVKCINAKMFIKGTSEVTFRYRLHADSQLNKVGKLSTVHQVKAEEGWKPELVSK